MMRYLSTAGTKHYDQGTLLKKYLVSFGFRGLEPIMAEARHSGSNS